MISSVSWVKKGCLKEMPKRYAPPKLKMQEKEEKTKSNTTDKFNMDNYDNEDDIPPFMTSEGSAASNTSEDPHVLVPEMETAQDLEDFMIKKEDMIVLAAVSEEDEVSHLDVYIYENSDSHIYIHHDYLLPAFPLCLTWLDFPVGGPSLSGQRDRTNMVAVGTFEPYIEIWDLDTVDQPAPLAILGGPENPNDIGKPITNKIKLVPGSHEDAVLSLSWNTTQRNILASASADKTVKIWDLLTGKCLKTYSHQDKVQMVSWNPAEPSILASGGFGGTLTLTDVRAAGPAGIINLPMGSDIESFTWLPPPNHSQLLVGTELGKVIAIDMLKSDSKTLWTLDAHVKATQALAVTGGGKLLATGSQEKDSPLKLWDLTDGKPKCLYSKTEDIGPIFSLKFADDLPFLLAVGTKSLQPLIVDTLDFSVVRERFYLPQQQEVQNNSSTTSIK